MIFAELAGHEKYADTHADLVKTLKGCFSSVEAGLQGDSWIWIMDGADKVAIDTFTSMTHQVKSCTAGPHVQQVIDALRVKYNVRVFDEPLEAWD